MEETYREILREIYGGDPYLDLVEGYLDLANGEFGEDTKERSNDLADRLISEVLRDSASLSRIFPISHSLHVMRVDLRSEDVLDDFLRSFRLMEDHVAKEARKLKQTAMWKDRQLQIVYPRASFVFTGFISACLLAGSLQVGLYSMVPWVVVGLVSLIGVCLCEDAAVSKNSRRLQKADALDYFLKGLSDLRSELAERDRNLRSGRAVSKTYGGV